mmetsp:Transcript_18668/g.28216  ORF Transcript_18668/g.28216 Transcript_18668/m.28216 type:complete len:186 (+) Transcript_18668:166-723(+)
MSAQREYNSAAAELYQWMDHELQQAFYVCYQNFGKISTKKLVACLGHADITRELVSRTQGELQIPRIRRNNSTDELAFAEENDFVIVTEDGGVMNNDIKFDCPHWLNNMPIGPGVSPCVDIACRVQLASHYAAASTGKNDESVSIDSFSFYRTLCENASELRTLVEKYEVDLNEVFGVAETPLMG